MNVLVETWKRGWYRLTNQPYHPPNRYATMPTSIYQHVFAIIRRQFLQAYQNAYQLDDSQVNNRVISLIHDMLTKNRLPKLLTYRHFTKPKKDGTWRQLVEPNALLKAIQSDILRSLLSQVDAHPVAMGFRKGKSIADHVWAHAGADVIITADIQDFFPNTHQNRVYDFWHQWFADEDVAHMFTLLTTYQGGLPQGAPTSPMLSNVVNYDMDKQIVKKIALSGGKYTRYGDDMVFSWHHRPPSDFERSIRAILRTAGYELHPQKGWQVYHKRDEPQITGVILTQEGGVEIPDWVKWRIAELRRSKDDNHRLQGYLAYRKMVERRP